MTIKFRLTIALFISLGLVAFSGAMIASAAGLERLNGRLLLQVEDRGKAWYVDPATGSRAYLGSQENALKVVRSFGLGISNLNIAKIDTSASLAKRLAGKILLQVESRGEAWYVNPLDLKKYYLGKPADMFEVMKKLSLGISNNDLARIPVLAKYQEEMSSGEDPADNPATSTPPVVPIATTTPPVASSTPPTPPVTPTCSSWTYSDWSTCGASKTQTRTVVSSAPTDCIGGQPVVSQACELSFNVNVTAANTPKFTVTDKATTEILYKVENASQIYPINVGGLAIENNLDTSGGVYYNETFLTVYDAQNKILATRNLVNNATNDLTLSEAVVINPQSSSTLRVVISGFGGDINSSHLMVRLLNMVLSPSQALLNGLPIDSNIYRN